MASVGGDIIEISYNHPTLGSGVFYPKAAEDSEFNLGGLRADDDSEGISGDGGIILKMNRTRWHFMIKVAWDMNNREDLQKAIALAGNSQLATYTFSHVNGTTWKGKGIPVGELIGNGNTATFDLKISGSGSLTEY